MVFVDVFFNDIMDYVGWKFSKTVFYYIKLKQVLNLVGLAVKLADLDKDTGKYYKVINELIGFVIAFSE